MEGSQDTAAEETEKEKKSKDIEPTSETQKAAEMKVSQEESEAERKKLVAGPNENEKQEPNDDDANENGDKSDENVIETLDEDISQKTENLENTNKKSKGIVDTVVSKFSFFSKFRKKKEPHLVKEEGGGDRQESEKQNEEDDERRPPQEENEGGREDIVLSSKESDKTVNNGNKADKSGIEVLEEDVDQQRESTKNNQTKSNGLLDSITLKFSVFSRFRKKEETNLEQGGGKGSKEVIFKGTRDNPEIVVTDEGDDKGAKKKNGKFYSDDLLPVSLQDIQECKKRNQDEVDAASIWSFVMKKDFRYYFQHPYLRLLIAYLVTLCNFLIYAEDPVAHSLRECSIPLIGSNFAFVITGYSRNAWTVLQVFLWLVGIILGLLIGKLLVHKILFNRIFRLRMFENDMGSWMAMFLTCLITVFIMACLYNAFLAIGGDSSVDQRISFQGFMGVSNSFFMKMAACGTWCGDFFTAWMVTDMMLQEKLYPKWAKPVRKWWNAGYHRIILFWVITSLTSFTVVFVISTDYIKWDKLNRNILSSNELSRSFLASFILVMDILIVLQDWDFPHFVSAIDIKLPGVNTAHINFNIPKCLKREVWKVHIEGKWFNYGILFLVIILDLNMWKNQIFYAPYDYGQYVDADGKIHTVLDEYSLNNFNETLLTYDYRSVTINPLTNATYLSSDSVMNTQYLGISLSLKGLAFIPSLALFVLFGVLVWKFGRRKPSDDDPYAGRLKKRKKRPKITFKSLSTFIARFRLKRKPRESPTAELTSFGKRSNPDQNGVEVINIASNEETETDDKKITCQDE